MKNILIIFALIALGGCSSFIEDFITQDAPKEVPETAFCDIKRFSLDVELPAANQPGMAAATRAQVQEKFHEDNGMDGSYGQSVASALARNDGDLLFLSGGSQDGAFGAGFLDEWQSRAGGSLPPFRVVTGISTGALQSTFAFIDQPEKIVAGYSIEREADLLDTEFDGADIRNGLSTKVVLAALRDGSFSDLVPLRGRISDLLTDDVFDEISTRYSQGRRLYVGATDVDAGRAIAFDMSELGNRIATLRDEARSETDGQARTTKLAEADRFKSCYIEALVASSSVPGASQPVFIDNRMYIDGGAKFAVFAEDVSKEIDQSGSIFSARAAELNNVYILLNGEAEFSFVCGKDDEADCVGDGPFLALKGRHIDWNFLFLAERSVSILTEQVTRLSIDRASILNRPGFNQARIVRLDRPASDLHRSDLGGAFGEGSRTCLEWQDEDIDNGGDPIEFQPRYMRCLISFGRAVAANTGWVTATP